MLRQFWHICLLLCLWPGLLGVGLPACTTTPGELLAYKRSRAVHVFLDHSPLLDTALVNIFSQRFGFGLFWKFYFNPFNSFLVVRHKWLSWLDIYFVFVSQVFFLMLAQVNQYCLRNFNKPQSSNIFLLWLLKEFQTCAGNARIMQHIPVQPPLQSPSLSNC